MARQFNVNVVVFVATCRYILKILWGVPNEQSMYSVPDGYMCLTKYCGVSLMNNLYLTGNIIYNKLGTQIGHIQ